MPVVQNHSWAGFAFIFMSFNFIYCTPSIFSEVLVPPGSFIKIFKKPSVLFSINKAHHVHKKSKSYFAWTPPYTTVFPCFLFCDYYSFLFFFLPGVSQLTLVNSSFFFVLNFRVVVKLFLGPYSSVVRAMLFQGKDKGSIPFGGAANFSLSLDELMCSLCKHSVFKCFLLNYIINQMSQKHPFHLVDPSPWPLVTSTAVFFIITGATCFFHNFPGGGFFCALGLCFVIMSIAIWWRDVIREGSFEGQHTSVVQLGLRFGMILFIVSEVIFFFAFFWAFFWASLAPTPEVGSVWPPKGVEVLNAWEVPFLNTLLLLTSGASVTWAHHAIVVGQRDKAFKALVVTICLATLFTSLQAFEYLHSAFTISDGIYGSTFYIATGFHGFHVLVGSLLLFVCLVRILLYHFTKQHHFGFEAAAWYWHFVDVVWLFLFVSIYWWGNLFLCLFLVLWSSLKLFLWCLFAYLILIFLLRILAPFFGFLLAL